MPRCPAAPLRGARARASSLRRVGRVEVSPRKASITAVITFLRSLYGTGCPWLTHVQWIALFVFLQKVKNLEGSFKKKKEAKRFLSRHRSCERMPTRSLR